MTEIRHTPWQVHEENALAVTDAAGGLVVECFTREDARFIAAAPDLLAACEAALRVRALWMPISADDLDEARTLHRMNDNFAAAIAKAKGETP